MAYLGKNVELISHMGDDRAIVNAARVSYGEGTRRLRDDKALINYLMANGHMSPFEFVEFTFRVKAPLVVARQWFRHRTGNFAEQSGRYSIVGTETYIPEPGEIRATKKAESEFTAEEGVYEYWSESNAKIFSEAAEDAINRYHQLLDNGVVREQARLVLPQGMMTSFYFKMDLRNLLNFLKQRLDPHAQKEIRVYAERILELIQPIVPFTIEAWENHVRWAVTLSRREWARLIDSFGADNVLDALVGAEPSKTRIKQLERLVGTPEAFEVIYGKEE